MTALSSTLPADDVEGDAADSSTAAASAPDGAMAGESTRGARLNPLAIAVFVVALTIAGLLVWLSFAGDDTGEQFIISLPEGATGSDTTLSGGTISVPPAPRVLDDPRGIAVTGGGETGDHTDTQTPGTDTTTGNETPDVEGTDGETSQASSDNLQKIGSLAPLPVGAPLREAPIAGLYEETSAGLLPVIAPNGARSVASYARPFAAPTAPTPGSSVGSTGEEKARPRIAIMIMGFGLNKTFAERALEQLPADISLAFTPYSGELQNQINAARADGHEVALELPMEPFNYPDNDPGPYTLLTSLPEEANRKRLEWLLARGAGYFATVNRQGGRYLSEMDALTPILASLKERGLGFVDTGDGARNTTAEAAPENGFNWVAGNQVIDASKSPRQIDGALEDLEKAARSSGMAVGIGTALPITVDRVAQWAATLDEKGIDLVPVSAAMASSNARTRAAPPTSPNP